MLNPIFPLPRPVVAVAALALLSVVVPGFSTSATAQQTVVVVFDDSGSMMESMRATRNQTKIDAARAAMARVLTTLPEDASVGVLAMNSRPESGHWIIPIGPVNRDQIGTQISTIQAAGGTPLGASVQTAADALLTARAKQIYGTYRMLIVTDGEASDANWLDLYLPIAKARGLIIDVIGVDMRGDHSLAQTANSYRRADDPASLDAAIAEVFAETTADSGDAGESDYEMLSGLPDEVAREALATLTTVDNSPLNQSVAQSAPPSAGNYNYPNPAVPPNRSTTPASQIGDLITGMFCCFGMLVVLILLPASLWKLNGKPDPRSPRNRR